MRFVRDNRKVRYYKVKCKLKEISIGITVDGRAIEGSSGVIVSRKQKIFPDKIKQG